MKRTVNVMFRSEFWGQGKTVAALSYSRPGHLSCTTSTGLDQPRRLLVDMEYRDMSYKSPDDGDHPELLLFAYDFFQDEYNHGDVTQDAITRLYTEIVSGEFPYDVLIFDNVALFQEELFVLLSDKRTAMAVAKTVRGVYERNRLFLDYKFKPTDSGGEQERLERLRHARRQGPGPDRESLGSLVPVCRRAAGTVPYQG